MNNLIIGSTAQLAQHFPIEYERISSRNINFKYFEDKFYDRIFFCFGETRTYLENSDKDLFDDVNLFYTKILLNFFINKCNHLIVYGTAELWNNYEGPIDISMPYNYNSTLYISSKEKMCKIINFMKKHTLNWNKIHIVHPFNFNSIHRKGNFLFGKIFDSLINKTKIEIGDTYFYRDLIHPKYVVEKSIETIDDIIVGSGRLIFVNDFIQDLYKNYNMNYNDYVTENINQNLKAKRRIFYLNKQNYFYNKLLEDTLKDIDEFRLQNKIS
jgi:hypothetical protein